MPRITEAKPKLLSPEGLAKLPKSRKDWLGVFGNTWGTRRPDAEPLTGEEKQALADALNPFARKNRMPEDPIDEAKLQEWRDWAKARGVCVPPRFLYGDLRPRLKQ